MQELVSWSLTSLFSTNMAISETNKYAGDLISPTAMPQKIGQLNKN